MTVKTITSYRRAETQVGDTLRDVALRELGDAARWADLAALNGLLPPYLTDDPGQASARVLLTGGAVLVPATAPTVSGVDDPDGVFGKDVGLDRGSLTVTENGDLATLAGIPNLDAALQHRIETRPGELIYHPDYGCRVHELLGGKMAEAVDRLAAAMVDSAVRSDPRISTTKQTTATIAGDALQASTTAITIDDKRVTVTLPR
ncbi:MAG: hypothetical protein GC191_09275 [Azospirillum sp.]|nr:hypothetical protein [Azospirillum sp.]